MGVTVKRWGSACAGALLAACSAAVVAPPEAALPSAVSAPDYAPQLADGYAALGRAQYEAMRYADALQSYRRAVQLNPHHVNARNGLAVLAAGQGDYRSAIALWRAALADAGVDSGADRAFLTGNLGYAYFLDGDVAQAAELLQQACVLDPLDALNWEHLGRVLEKMGQGERAGAMLKQARTLRQHDARGDYAALQPAVAASPDMARTELTRVGAVMEVRRVSDAGTAASAAAGAASLRIVTAAANAGGNDSATVALNAGGNDSAVAPLPLQLEISNGNGVTGMAAALARTIGAREWRVVRLSNLKPYAVAVSRIDYRADQRAAARVLALRLGLQVMREYDSHAGLRLVLGRDLRDPQALARRYRQPAPAGLALSSRP